MNVPDCPSLMQSKFEDIERRDDPIRGDRDRGALQAHRCL